MYHQSSSWTTASEIPSLPHITRVSRRDRDEREEVPWGVLTSKHEAATPVADGLATMVSQHHLYKRDGTLRMEHRASTTRPRLAYLALTHWCGSLPEHLVQLFANAIPNYAANRHWYRLSTCHHRNNASAQPRLRKPHINFQSDLRRKRDQARELRLSCRTPHLSHVPSVKGYKCVG
jgi:hypothetical protein